MITSRGNKGRVLKRNRDPVNLRFIELRGSRSLKEWAKETGMNPSHWNAFETTLRRPAWEILERICRKTGTSPLWLMFGKGDRRLP